MIMTQHCVINKILLCVFGSGARWASMQGLEALSAARLPRGPRQMMTEQDLLFVKQTPFQPALWTSVVIV